MKNNFTLSDKVQLRSTDPVYSTVLSGGRNDINGALIVIENNHDQIVACQVQGKSRAGLVWQSIGSSVNVAAISNGVPGATNIFVDKPWDLIRVAYTPAGTPTSGSLSAWVNCSFSGM